MLTIAPHRLRAAACPRHPVDLDQQQISSYRSRHSGFSSLIIYIVAGIKMECRHPIHQKQVVWLA